MWKILIHAIIILSSSSLTLKRSSAAAVDYQYEACRVPKSCGSGPNVSYPFYIPSLQESYCGYPGFALNCSNHGLPILNLSGDNYVVRDINYSNNSIRVYDASVVTSLSSRSEVVYSCPKLFQNTMIPTSSLFTYASGIDNVTQLHLFSNCSALSGKIDLSSYRVQCNNNYPSGYNASERVISYGALVNENLIIAMYDEDENLKEARKKCATSAVKQVDGQLEKFSGHSYNATAALEEVLRGGIGLSWTASDCRPCKASGGSCGFNIQFYRFSCFCRDGPHDSTCEPEMNSQVANPPEISSGVKSVTGIVSGLLAVVYVVFMLHSCIKRCQTIRRNKNMEVFLRNHGDVAPKRYQYSQLKKMTNKFKESLGKGGYGCVYKGKLSDGSLVAVKILDKTKGNGEEFLNEVACISRTSHVNIVSLLGFCLEGSRRALVYEYMPNGSLDKFIHSSSSSSETLSWEKLFDIALGIARGLDYLHQGCRTRILHLDIKPHNILLDNDLHPKISDFGLAKLCPDRASIVSMSGTRGTVGYIAPELFSTNFGTVSYKSDVYSYGMMVLEMVGERVNRNVRRSQVTSSSMYFPHWIYKNLETNFEDDEIEDDEYRLVKRKMTIVGLWCIQNDSKDRPTMTKVVEMLEGDVESLQVPPKPCLSSPAKEVQDESSISASGRVTSDFDET